MKRLFYVLAALAVAGTGCNKSIQEDNLLTPLQQSLDAKLVGENNGEIVPGTLLVRLDAASVSQLENGGYPALASELFADVTPASFSPAIPVAPGNKAVAEKYGLDQWFIIGFDESISPESVALKIAQKPMVRSIQYNRYIQPVRAEKAYPFEGMPATKADSESLLPFDDPYNSAQWNLVNDGSAAADAVAGADVGVKDAWRLTAGDPSVIVAIFDCGVEFRHEDLKDAMWRNEAEISGQADVDDDGNGFIDDKYGFNFVNCFAIDSDYVAGLLDEEDMPAVDGQDVTSKNGVGHGTHVAGIIGATNGNGRGISSIAGGTGNGDGVRLMSCQIFDGSSYTTDAQSAAAFIYAADNGACIAQCSYGNYNVITDDNTYLNGGMVGDVEIKGSPLENAALRYFLDPANSNHESLEGNIAVFAAGNHSNPYSIYPGALPYVLSVTAFGYDWLPGGYTNYGPGCNIAAPGGEWKGITGEYDGMILSTGVQASVNGGYPGYVTDKGSTSKNYVYMQGTSMACPHVSGVIALGISYAKKIGKKFTREELSSLLLTSVNDIDQFNKGGSKDFNPPFSTNQTVSIDMDRYKGKMGTGAVDAWKFLMAIEGTPSVLVKAGEKVRIDLSEYCNPAGQYTVSIDESGKASLGIETDPVIKDGFLEIECTKIGAGKVVLSSSVGKDPEREDGIGGMAYSREISIVARAFAAENGGWL